MIFRRIVQSPFLKNISVLMVGTVASQLIALLVYPALTRLYQPEDFGLYGLYFSLIGIFGTVVTVRYELAVPLPEQRKDRDQMVVLSIGTAGLFSIVLLLTSVLLKEKAALWLNNPSIGPWLPAVAPVVFLIGFYQSFNYWLLREKAFKSSSINRISQKGAEAPLGLALGLMQVRSGLIWGDILGRFTMSIIAWRQSVKLGFVWDSVQWKNLKSLALRYRDFPVYGSLPALADAIGMYLPVLLVSNFYDDETTGFFNNSRLLLSIPIVIISRNLAQALLPRILEKRQNGERVFPDVLKIFTWLSAATVPGVLVLMWIAPDMFALFLGEKWRVSGHFTQILAVAYGLRFLSSSLSVVFTALEKIRWVSYWQVFFFFCIVSLSLLKPHEPKAETFLLIMTIVESVCYLLYLLLILREALRFDERNG